MHGKWAMQRRIWIIGYGNKERCDDGAGPVVAERLQFMFRNRPEIIIRSVHQLDPVLVDDTNPPEDVILIDATLDQQVNGLRVQMLMPEKIPLPFSLHHLPPGLFLELLGQYHGYYPSAWLVTIQGNDFGFGTGLTGETEKRALRAVKVIAGLAVMKVIDSPKDIKGQSLSAKGVKYEK
ncbi:MAG: hydrogenase maturation protease [Proteobacteria bacterium]|nr:hydrogenase maturation protease [Pseudomonadota bacterium]